MRTMPQDGIVCGVDTHADTHMAAVLDTTGRLLAVDEFTATSSGYRELMVWLTGFGSLAATGVEGTSSYGKGLTWYPEKPTTPSPKTSPT